jgi:hypothetical protein
MFLAFFAFKNEPYIELNTICIIEIAIASLIIKPESINIGTKIVPPPIPKKPDTKPVINPKSKSSIN